MGYAIARILEVLNNSGESNFATLDKKLSISTCGQLLHLNKLGLVEYESIPIDTYSGVSAKGAATITLLDKVKLEEYIQDDNKLRQDVLSVKPKYREWGYLRRALELKEEKLDYISLSNKLGLREGNHSSKVISTLVKLGIYKYDHFEYRALSKVRITDKGRVAYALAFKPVLEIARNPNSQYEIGLYDVKVEENEIVNLFKEELVRFEATSNYLNTKPMLETTQLTISLLRDTHKDRTFRQTDVIEVLSKAGFVGDLRNKAKQVLRLLRGQNEIESAGKNGFYKLKEPMAVWRIGKRGYYKLKDRL